jgi:hypothetical protein
MQTIIYMPLLNEGTDVWAPIASEQFGPQLYRLIGPVPVDQTWQYGGPGDIARVAHHTFSDGQVGLAVVGLESA